MEQKEKLFSKMKAHVPSNLSSKKKAKRKTFRVEEVPPDSSTIVESITNYPESPAYKHAKLAHANKIAKYFIVAYFVVIGLYIILPLFGVKQIPEAVSVIEKLSTTFIAMILGFYFSQN